MNNLNSILIEGNLVKDPTFRVTARGTPLCTFTLASNRYYRQDTELEKEVGFFDVETWSKLAESCNNLGRKGRGVRVVGRLKQDRWTGPDGKSHSRVAIVAEHVEWRPDFKKEGGKSFEANHAAEALPSGAFPPGGFPPGGFPPGTFPPGGFAEEPVAELEAVPEDAVLTF